MSTSNRFSRRLLQTVSVLATLLAMPGHARADFEVTPIKMDEGPQLSWGHCPCFRWVVQVRGAQGQLETRDFLISSDALFQYEKTATLDFQEVATQLYNVGNLEALWKGGHIGVAFNGVTWGKERDKGYSDLLQTGFRMIANLILREATRLDIHSGLDYQNMRVNNGPIITRDLLTQAMEWRWRSGGWNGDVNAHVSFDARHLTDTQYIDTGASASIRGRFLSIHELQVALGFKLDYDHDGIRNLMGLSPDLWTGTLLMDFSYVSGKAPRP